MLRQVRLVIRYTRTAEDTFEIAPLPTAALDRLGSERCATERESKASVTLRRDRSVHPLFEWKVLDVAIRAHGNKCHLDGFCAVFLPTFALTTCKAAIIVGLEGFLLVHQIAAGTETPKGEPEGRNDQVLVHGFSA